MSLRMHVETLWALFIALVVLVVLMLHETDKAMTVQTQLIEELTNENNRLKQGVAKE